ncbi:MAG: T9SS type A sorting domain-containing protein [Ignavibacteriales bacterium]|nr:T9SS type A sorting domain-containing protein [Ignavibacteriales bacterium]
MKKAIYSLFAFGLVTAQVFSQSFWERTEPYAGTLNKMYFGGGDTIYGTLGSGFTRSTNNGTSWSQPVIVDYVTDMAVAPNGYIFLSENQKKMSRSTNKGSSWTIVGTGINEPSCNTVMATSTGTILTGTNRGIYRTTNNGDNWTKVAGGVELGADSNVTVMATANGSTLFAFTRIFTGSDYSFALRSTDDGLTWTKGTNKLDSVAIYKAVVHSSGSIYARTGNGLRFSSDGGNTWSTIGFYNEYISDVAVQASGEVYATISDDQSVLHKTTNNGASWSTISLPFQKGGTFSIGKNGDIFVGQDQLYRSTDGGATWKGLPIGYPNVTHMTESPTHELFFTAGGSAYQGVYRSSDFGQTWKPVNTGVVGVPIVGFYADTIFVGDDYYQATLYRSTDNGVTFAKVTNSTGLGGYVQKILGTSFNFLLIGSSNGIYRSKDHAKNWEKVFNSGTIISLRQTPGGTLYAVRQWSGDGVYRSDDSGSTWQQKLTGIPFPLVRSFDIAPNGDLFLGAEGGIYRSTNSGDEWVRIDTQKVNKPYGIYVTVNKQGKIFAGGAKNGINSESYYSTNNGATWAHIDNMTTIDNQANIRGLFAASDGHLFAATSAGVFRSKEVTTEVKRVGVSLPAAFILEQNFPNPFNPSTDIRFSLSKNGFTSLKIFDLIGREVTTLMEQQLSSGTYQVTFNAEKFASGIYIYRLQSGSIRETKRMMLVK